MQSFPRRSLLKVMALTSTIGALKPLSALAAVLSELPGGKDSGNFLVHSELPLALETRRSSFGFSPITSTSDLFVRNNLPMPSASINEDPDEWELEVTGTAII